jgi:uncharacterized protein (DUF2147 family)
MTAFPVHPQTSFHARRRRGQRPVVRRAGIVAAVTAVMSLAAPALAAPLEDIVGTWLTDENEGAIEVRPCGDQRCGRIVWMKEPKGKDGKPPLDRNNPDPKLRSNTICGLQIISGLKPQSDGSWGDGQVYDPDTGKTYGMKIRRETADSVKATGYMGFELFGRSMEWRRAPKNLGRCEDATKGT